MGSFPINALPVLLTPIWVRLPKTPGEEPFPSLTLFLVSHTRGERKRYYLFTHTYTTHAHVTERMRDTERACIKIKVGFYLGQ